MIEKPTVFVLGAGAHCSYGFPGGEQLKTNCVRNVRNSLTLRGDDSFVHLANHGKAHLADVQPDRCNAFVEALENSGQASIDAFLNANRHQAGFEAIGKGAIARVLLWYEAETPKSDDDWLSYLFKVMVDGVSTPDQFAEQNRLGFVTFNYDRFLEKWLFQKIKFSFGLNDKEALPIFQKIPIHHVYGTLGLFPIPESTDPFDWIEASQSIRTIFDAEHDQTTLDAAKSLLADAERICLLGFGFHKENIDLLDLVTHARSCDSNVVGSSFEITKTEWERHTRMFGTGGVNIVRAQESQRCLNAIKNLPVF